MSILDRIDATLDGLCPCGAQPRDGSAYCSDDCVPTWRGRDTISDLDGTAMRWTPGPRMDQEAVRTTFRGIAAAMCSLAEALKPAIESMQRAAAQLNVPAPEADHPLSRMTARRANRVYGPTIRQRPPRAINPRR